MKKIKTEYGSDKVVVSFEEKLEIEVYAKSILEAVQKFKKYPESDCLQGLYMEFLFQDAQAIADYSKVVSKRLGRKPRRSDHLNLVEKASETIKH